MIIIGDLQGAMREFMVANKPTKEEKDEQTRGLKNAILGGVRGIGSLIFGEKKKDAAAQTTKEGGGFLSNILGGLSNIGNALGGNFIKGVIGVAGLGLALVGFSFGLKKLMEVGS